MLQRNLAWILLTIRGELRERLLRSFDRLEGPEYHPETVVAFTENNQQWPGDYEGRTILALARLWQVTGREPLYLNQILKELPQHFNSEGYLGTPLKAVGGLVFNEQQLAGHGWLVSGLLAAYSIVDLLAAPRFRPRPPVPPLPATP